MELHVWLTFFAASWAISLSPGAGAVAAMSSGLTHGFRRGYWTTAGLILGIWTQVLLVGVGLGALVATSTTLFTVIKWAGVAYLIYLGVQQWRAPARPLVAGDDGVGGGALARRRDLVLRGWMVNTINPKGTVFLLAVMPQFLDTQAPLLAQYLTIGATFGVVEFAVMTGYVALASKLLGLLRSPRQMQWLNRIFGSLFILAGVALARFHRHT